MHKLNTKINIIWMIISAICLAAFSFAYLGEQNILVKLLLWIGYTLVVPGILLFETKTYLGMLCFGLSEVIQGIANSLVNTQNGVNGITVEGVLGYIMLASAVCLIAFKMRKEKKKPNIKAVIELESKPFKTSLFVNLILVAMITIIVATMSTSYLDLNKGVSPLSMLYVMLPTFILLVTIIPTSISMYLRLIYYVLWIWVLGMAISTHIASEVNLIEPIIYLVSILLSRLTLLTNMKRIRIKDKDKNKENTREE